RIHSDFTEYMEANIAVTARREKCNAEVFECPYLEEQDPVLVEISNSSDYGVGYMGYFTSYEEANCSYSDEVTAHSSVAMPCGVKKWQNEICFQFYIVENNYPSGGSHVYPEVCAALR
ncbi:hypothetical protein KKG08_00700, partial [Patescibacteria group bacterium]|nr:hypothetical protein [Patescibacteria group bacterium]